METEIDREWSQQEEKIAKRKTNIWSKEGKIFGLILNDILLSHEYSKRASEYIKTVHLTADNSFCQRESGKSRKNQITITCVTVWDATSSYSKIHHS